MEITKIKEAVTKEGVWFTPKDINGKKMDISFCVLGTNTEEYRRIRNKNAVSYSSNRKGEKEEALSKGTVNTLLACVTDWKGITESGKEHPCTRENKKALFEDASVKWLCDQIEEFILDDSNFLLAKE